MPDKAIDSFSDKYEFLSNFYPVHIVHGGIVYATLEHAFQALKTLDQEEREFIAGLRSPGEAKRYGRKVDLRADWNVIRIPVMRELLLIKFGVPRLQRKLLNTGEVELIEGNYWNDTFWGVCRGRGENNLGKLLMEVRETYRLEQ